MEVVQLLPEAAATNATGSTALLAAAALLIANKNDRVEVQMVLHKEGPIGPVAVPTSRRHQQIVIRLHRPEQHTKPMRTFSAVATQLSSKHDRRFKRVCCVRPVTMAVVGNPR